MSIFTALKLEQKIRSPTGRGVLGCSGGARKSRMVSFNSAHQAKLIGLGAKILPPGTHFYYSKTPPKKQNFERRKIEIAIL
jgi:hypothetical protein